VDSAIFFIKFSVLLLTAVVLVLLLAKGRVGCVLFVAVVAEDVVEVDGGVVVAVRFVGK